MLLIPTLTAQELEEVREIRKTPGWNHLIEPIIVSVDLTHSALVNWEWDRDKDNEITKKSVGLYEKKQQELYLLKSFLAYIENDDIIEEDENRDVFDNTSK